MRRPNYDEEQAGQFPTMTKQDCHVELTPSSITNLVGSTQASTKLQRGTGRPVPHGAQTSLPRRVDRKRIAWERYLNLAKLKVQQWLRLP